MKTVPTAFKTLKSLPVSAAILDSSGEIVAVNAAWKAFGRQNGLRVPNFGIASNYLQYCRSDEPEASRFVEQLRELLAGQLDLLTLVYPCHSLNRKRWFCLIGLPLSLDKAAGVALLHVNFTGMLPLPIRTHLTHKMRRKDLSATLVGLGTVSGAIARSASETLSSQLNAMVTSTGRDSVRKEISADHKTTKRAYDELSKRQLQVLRLLGMGKTNKEIADALFRSPNTIKLHVSAILRRLKLKTRTQAALLASSFDQEGSVDVLESGTREWKECRRPCKAT